MQDKRMSPVELYRSKPKHYGLWAAMYATAAVTWTLVGVLAHHPVLIAVAWPFTWFSGFYFACIGDDD